ncbi:hypothetical protein BH23CHL2_BH23CHL2_34320 [soil metagenome]
MDEASGTVRRARQYTVDEVSQVMGVSAETVRRWIREGELKAEMLRMGAGGGYRITHEELECQVRERYPYLRLALEE